MDWMRMVKALGMALMFSGVWLSGVLGFLYVYNHYGDMGFLVMVLVVVFFMVVAACYDVLR